MRLIGLTVVLSLVLVPLAAEGQETPKIHRIGVLSVPPAYLEAFEESLRQLGDVRGRNILFETRSVGGLTDSLAGAAADLARLNVEVIVTGPDRFIDAAKKATTTVPIIMVYGSDPIGRGYMNLLNGEHRGSIVSFAAGNRLPTVFGDRAFVDAGGLMSYGVSFADLFRRLPTYIDKILRVRSPPTSRSNSPRSSSW